MSKDPSSSSPQTLRWDMLTGVEAPRSRSSDSLRAFDRDEREAAHVLRERASQLAAPASFADIAGLDSGRQLIRFRSGESFYGLELYALREIRKSPKTAVVPCTPRYVLGLIQVHGEITPVIDLVEFFRLRRAEPLRFPLMIIVMETRGRLLGIAVDELEDVHSLTDDTIKPIPIAIGNVERDVARGVTRDRTVVLNPEALILHPRLRASEG